MDARILAVKGPCGHRGGAQSGLAKPDSDPGVFPASAGLGIARVSRLPTERPGKRAGFSTYAKNVLADASWLSERLGDERLRIIEVDENFFLYAQAPYPRGDRLRLAGGPAGPVAARLFGPEAFGELLGGRGVSNDHTIVLYGDRSNWFAAYAYWYLKYYGHDDVLLLDGPREKWIADGPAHVGRVARFRAGDVCRPRLGTRAFAPATTEVLAALQARARLVDVRSRWFTGEVMAPPGYEHEGAQRAGHRTGHRVGAVGAGCARGRHVQVPR